MFDRPISKCLINSILWLKRGVDIRSQNRERSSLRSKVEKTSSTREEMRWSHWVFPFWKDVHKKGEVLLCGNGNPITLQGNQNSKLRRAKSDMVRFHFHEFFARNTRKTPFFHRKLIHFPRKFVTQIWP